MFTYTYVVNGTTKTNSFKTFNEAIGFATAHFTSCSAYPERIVGDDVDFNHDQILNLIKQESPQHSEFLDNQNIMSRVHLTYTEPVNSDDVFK